jgi:hypothetical protein
MTDQSSCPPRRYFYANAVYLVYSSGMLLINYGGFDEKTTNNLYLIFGMLHIVSTESSQSVVHVSSHRDFYTRLLPIIPCALPSPPGVPLPPQLVRPAETHPLSPLVTRPQVNAWMYVWAWKNRSWGDRVVVPEWMNVVGSGLYMASATMYGYEDRSQPRSTVIMAVSDGGDGGDEVKEEKSCDKEDDEAGDWGYASKADDDHADVCRCTGWRRSRR